MNVEHCCGGLMLEDEIKNMLGIDLGSTQTRNERVELLLRLYREMQIVCGDVSDGLKVIRDHLAVYPERIDGIQKHLAAFGDQIKLLNPLYIEMREYNVNRVKSNPIRRESIGLPKEIIDHIDGILIGLDRFTAIDCNKKNIEDTVIDILSLLKWIIQSVSVLAKSLNMLGTYSKAFSQTPPNWSYINETSWDDMFEAYDPSEYEDELFTEIAQEINNVGMFVDQLDIIQDCQTQRSGEFLQRLLDYAKTIVVEYIEPDMKPDIEPDPKE